MCGTVWDPSLVGTVVDPVLSEVGIWEWIASRVIRFCLPRSLLTLDSSICLRENSKYLYRVLPTVVSAGHP